MIQTNISYIELSILIFSALTIGITGSIIYYKLSRWRKRKAIMIRAQKGESQARKYLQKHGFTILEEQATRRFNLIEDGQKVEFISRADFLVKKGLRAIGIANFTAIFLFIKMLNATELLYD